MKTAIVSDLKPGDVFLDHYGHPLKVQAVQAISVEEAWQRPGYVVRFLSWIGYPMGIVMNKDRKVTLI